MKRSKTEYGLSIFSTILGGLGYVLLQSFWTNFERFINFLALSSLIYTALTLKYKQSFKLYVLYYFSDEGLKSVYNFSKFLIIIIPVF